MVYHLTRRAPQSSVDVLQSIGRWGTWYMAFMKPQVLSDCYECGSHQWNGCRPRGARIRWEIQCWWVDRVSECFWKTPWIGNRSSTFGSINEATWIGQDSNLEAGIFLGLWNTETASVVVIGLVFGYQHGISNSKITQYIESSYGRGPWSWFDRALGSVAGQLWLCWHWNTYISCWVNASEIGHWSFGGPKGRGETLSSWRSAWPDGGYRFPGLLSTWATKMRPTIAALGRESRTGQCRGHGQRRLWRQQRLLRVTWLKAQKVSLNQFNAIVLDDPIVKS